MKYYKIIIFLIILLYGIDGFSKPRVTINKDPFQFPDPKSVNTVVITRTYLDANNISSIFQNTGIFNQNTTSGNTAGFYWPKGTTKTACFTAGLCIGCYITDANGVPHLAEVMASYKGEYAPSAIKRVNGLPMIDKDAKFKMYSVKLGDNATTNPDYANWGLMVPYGAPYDDVNHNGQYDAGVDIPGQKSAGQTLFEVMTDADVSQRTSGEGFGGGIQSPLLNVEIHFTAWAYTSTGLEDLQFINWVIINKGDSAWRRTYTGVVVDPDLGDQNDDYIGCDTTNKINLGYCYNGRNTDATYGTAPPAFGMDYFKSPIVKNPDGSQDTLGLTSFTFFTNNSVNPPACESDPNPGPDLAYNMLKGFKKNGVPYFDPTSSPYQQTKFCYTGDPENGTGWTELKGCIQNCDTNPTPVLTTNPYGDRRFIFASGRESFVINPGDTQNIVLAQFVARGSSYTNSVTVLKQVAKAAKTIYLSNFNVTPPPPVPVVTPSFTPLLNGLCNITLSWDTKAESYRYWDSVFHFPNDSNIYTFEGYEIYEINKYATASLPDFSKPATVDLNSLQLIDCFDIVDGIGQLVDTFATGANINGNEQYGTFPIVPPYKMTAPPSFPDKGISRGITLTGTKYSQNYGGQSSFVYGQEYKFAVVVYAVSKSTKLKKGFRVLRNSVSTSVISIRPIAPPAGTVYSYHNTDTLNTSCRDLSMMPIIRNQELLKSATYRLVFNVLAGPSSDTTYNILKRPLGAQTFDTLFKNLKFTGATTPTADMSAVTYDGLLFKPQKIRWNKSGSSFDATSKIGVIKDINSKVSSDSLQTRYPGWEYKPANHLYLSGSKFSAQDQKRQYQSVSMSLSYPCSNTWTNQSSKYSATSLRRVKIVFSNTNTQMAYRYIDTTSLGNYYTYQNMVSVPFKVYEADYTDSTTSDVQLNCGFIESNKYGHSLTGQWNPTSDSLGGGLQLVIFASAYDTSRTEYKYTGTNPANLFAQTKALDIQYVWAPRLTSPGATFSDNDEFWIYPYTISIPYIQGPNYPLYFEFTTTAPLFGDVNTAKNSNSLDKVRVVPNPYYGFSTLDRSASDKFVTFRNLPLQCTIKIYTLNGDLIRTLVKTNSGNTSTSSTIEWNLQNLESTPVASGVYIALIDAPGIGTKVVKLAIFTSQERVNF